MNEIRKCSKFHNTKHMVLGKSHHINPQRAYRDWNLQITTAHPIAAGNFTSIKQIKHFQRKNFSNEKYFAQEQQFMKTLKKCRFFKQIIDGFECKKLGSIS